MKASRKIVFFFPSFASTEATAPLGLLAISTPLLRAGYDVRIIDSTITPNFQRRVVEEARDALCGVSLVTGPMIRETVEIGRAVKASCPDCPVILGGWHPSLLPTQTLAADFVDVVVCGQGEDAMLEIAERLRSGEGLDDVAGIGLKRDGKPMFTRPRPLRPLAEMPPKAYELADFDAYERLCGRRFPGAEFCTNIFTPYPGSPIMQRPAEIGIEAPTSLEGWADFFPRYTVLPWLKGREHTRLSHTDISSTRRASFRS